MRRRRRRAAAAIAAVTIVVPACDAGSERATGSRGAIEYVPASAAFYLEVAATPSQAQAGALSELRDLLPAGASETPWDEAIGAVFEAPLSALGLDFANDVEPWLGAEAAAFTVTDGAEDETALLFAVDDVTAAEATIAKVEEELRGRATVAIRGHGVRHGPRERRLVPRGGPRRRLHGGRR